MNQIVIAICGGASGVLPVICFMCIFLGALAAAGSLIPTAAYFIIAAAACALGAYASAWVLEQADKEQEVGR